MARGILGWHNFRPYRPPGIRRPQPPQLFSGRGVVEGPTVMDIYAQMIHANEGGRTRTAAGGRTKHEMFEEILARMEEDRLGLCWYITGELGKLMTELRFNIDIQRRKDAVYVLTHPVRAWESAEQAHAVSLLICEMLNCTGQKVTVRAYIVEMLGGQFGPEYSPHQREINRALVKALNDPVREVILEAVKHLISRWRWDSSLMEGTALLAIENALGMLLHSSCDEKERKMLKGLREWITPIGKQSAA